MTRFGRYTDYTSPQTTDRFLIQDQQGLPKSVSFTNLRNAISTASGDASTNTSTSVDSEIAIFSGTGGKTLKRATTTGIVKATSGVIGAATQGTDYYAPGGTDVVVADGGTGASTATNARTNLGLVIGTDIQAHGTILDDLNAISASQGDVLYNNGSNWVRLAAGTSGQVLRTNGAGANPSWGTSSAGQTLYEAVVAPSNGDYTTIGAAITAGKTRIFVRNGTYSESAINITTAGVRIVGETMDGVIVQMGSAEITMNATNIHIENLSFTTWGTSGAIKATTSADYCTLACVLFSVSSSTNVPVQLIGAKRMVVRDCQWIVTSVGAINSCIADSGTACSVLIVNNIFNGNFIRAVWITSGSIVRFIDNWCTSNASAVSGGLVHMDISTALHDNIIANNYFVTGAANNHYGILINNADRIMISGNHFGVGNSFARCISLVGSDDTLIHSNYAEDGAVGIYIDSACNDVILRNNNFKRCATPLSDAGIRTNKFGNIFASAPFGPIFDHFADAGNTTTTETDLYSDTTAANQFFTNGDKIVAVYGGIFVNSTSTKQLKVYFAGTAIFDSGALSTSAATDWQIRSTLIRVSSSVVRCSISLDLTGASTANFAKYIELTSLTLSGTNILKITGTAASTGAATNDIVAKVGTVEYKQAA